MFERHLADANGRLLGVAAPVLRAFAVSTTLLLASGCALQLGGGVQDHGPGHPVGGAMDIEGRLVDVEARDGAYASGHMVLADPDAPSRFGVRRGTVGGGLRAIRGPITTEIGAEIGAGEPTHLQYEGLGFYAGHVGSLFFRAYGDQDVEPGFAPISLLLDFGATVRGGVWLPPRETGGEVLPEQSVQLAVRITLISDVLDSTGGEIAQ